jgi:peptide/nickel transport system substrate-binding protein
MRRRTTMVLASVGTALALTLSACGGGTADDDQGGGGTFNGAIGKVVNPSTGTGGTLKFANSGEPDSTDPGDQYYGYAWNTTRLYGRALTMFKTQPGEAGLQLTGDLAQGLGESSDNNRTWTYKLRPGVKFEDGTPVTSKDVKYAVMRSMDKETFVHGPAYFNDYLDPDYEGPYKAKGEDLEAIETPDDQTIVFHLTKPFSGFDYFVMLPQTVPVPQAKDTGEKYKEHPISTGPYMFESYQAGKSFTLVKNPNWDPATDPNRKQLVDRIEMQLNQNADDIDNRLLSGDLHVDVAGTGIQPAANGRVLNDQNNRRQADNTKLDRLWFWVINPDVKPFDKVECRRAIHYAVDKVAMQTAYGGPVTGGVVTHNLLQAKIPGAQAFNLYPTPGNRGDVNKARQQLQACGAGNISTNIAYRAERPREKAAAEAMQQALNKVGIQTQLKAFPQGDYFSAYAGKPEYARDNNLGIMAHGWGSDWPDGFGFLSQIVDSRVIRDSGNSNLGVKVPEVDRLLDEASAAPDVTAAQAIWPQIDRKVMENAVYLPIIHATSLLYRSPALKNVYIAESFGMYDYVSLSLN